MGEAKGGRRCVPIGRKAIRAEFCGSIAALRALRAALENAARFLSSAPCRVRIPARGSKKPATEAVTGFQTRWCPQRDVRVRLRRPPPLRRFRALRAALENAARFLSSAPCRVRIPAQGSKKPATEAVTGFSIQMVPPTGFEPVISTLKGWRPWPLDDGDSAVEYTRYLVCEKAIFHVNSQC